MYAQMLKENSLFEIRLLQNKEKREPEEIINQQEIHLFLPLHAINDEPFDVNASNGKGNREKLADFEVLGRNFINQFRCGEFSLQFLKFSAVSKSFKKKSHKIDRIETKLATDFQPIPSSS